MTKRISPDDGLPLPPRTHVDRFIQDDDGIAVYDVDGIRVQPPIIDDNDDDNEGGTA